MSGLVDKVASRLMVVNCERVFGNTPKPWDELHEMTRSKWREDAKSALNVVADHFWCAAKDAEIESDGEVWACAAAEIEEEINDR